MLLWKPTCAFLEVATGMRHTCMSLSWKEVCRCSWDSMCSSFALASGDRQKGNWHTEAKAMLPFELCVWGGQDVASEEAV